MSTAFKLTFEEENQVANISPEKWPDFKKKLMDYRQQMEDAWNKGSTELSQFYSTKRKDCFPPILMDIGRRHICEILYREIPDFDARILEVGAGWGRSGVAMKQFGFTNVDALEPSTSTAKAPKGTYKMVYNEGIEVNHNTSIDDGLYDCVYLVATVFPGHIEGPHFPELNRIIKPGGLLFFDISDNWLQKEPFYSGIHNMIQAYLQDGTWDSVKIQRRVYIYNMEKANSYIVRVN